ncbi:MAG: hypothetical protein R6W77_16090 [Trueperaceae bacterium]
MKPARISWIVASLLALVMTACAPAVSGATPTRPIVVADDMVSVRRGAVVYLRLEYELDEFDMMPRDVRPVLWVPSGYASETGDVSSDFALRDVRAAEGWQVELHQMRADRRSVAGAPFESDSVEYTVSALLRVTIPDGIVPGPYRVRGTLQERGGATVPVSIRLDVQP